MEQKDAHEFLMSLLENIEGLKPVMIELSNKTEKFYKCAVNVHLSFRMQNTRPCMRCGHSSRTEENFNNLSLNLVPQESVQDMLDNYLLETDTEYKCVCGGTNSTQQYSFKTLPRVLILHVKRFCYTSSWSLKKLHNNVNISRELFVSSHQDTMLVRESSEEQLKDDATDSWEPCTQLEGRVSGIVGYQQEPEKSIQSRATAVATSSWIAICGSSVGGRGGGSSVVDSMSCQLIVEVVADPLSSWTEIMVADHGRGGS
ncbi:unnamed protein product [Pleuronectes platessa]|uniref:USP domain-containing protein n=1 Tax=Pleuronectes platessa TaxID=8262 RepID=A0A9N7VM78_PLEPL|nr:unnamed protein product [Pleuronectes platessa]